MSLDKALDELMDGDIIVFQKYVLFEGFDHFVLVAEFFFSKSCNTDKTVLRTRVRWCLKCLTMLTDAGCLWVLELGVERFHQCSDFLKMSTVSMSTVRRPQRSL